MIAPPFLPRGFRKNALLNQSFKNASLYGGTGLHGYVDYPEIS